MRRPVHDREDAPIPPNPNVMDLHKFLTGTHFPTLEPDIVKRSSGGYRHTQRWKRPVDTAPPKKTKPPRDEPSPPSPGNQHVPRHQRLEYNVLASNGDGPQHPANTSWTLGGSERSPPRQRRWRRARTPGPPCASPAEGQWLQPPPPAAQSPPPAAQTRVSARHMQILYNKKKDGTKDSFLDAASRPDDALRMIP